MNKYTEDMKRAADFFESLEPLELMMKIKKEALEEVMADVLPKGVSYDAVRVQTSPVNRMEELFILIDEATAEMTNAKNAYVVRKKECMKVIEEVRSEDKELAAFLEKKYCIFGRDKKNKKSGNEKKALDMNYSKSTFYRRQPEALQAAADAIKKLGIS